MKSILYLGNKLSKHGKNPTGVEILGSKLASLGFEVRSASSLKNPILRLMDMWWQICRHRRHTDLVLIDTYSTLNFYYALSSGALCRILKLPYIPILHGGNLPERFRKNPGLCRFLFGHAQINIAPSAYTQQALQKLGIEKVKIISNFLELDLYPFKERKSLRAHLLWVRAFKDLYRPEWAVQAAIALKEKGYPVKLCMVGPALDASFERCKKLADAHQLDVVFTGKMAKQQWIALSKDYDIFLNTSQVDNLPVSVLEAMALGLVVVSTDVGGIPFLISNGKNGLLFPTDNPILITKRLEKLLEKPYVLKQITSAGRLTAEEYKWQKIQRAWIQVLC